jgi:hypothetical protein
MTFTEIEWKSTLNGLKKPKERCKTMKEYSVKPDNGKCQCGTMLKETMSKLKVFAINTKDMNGNEKTL